MQGLPWWRSGWESACQCRGQGFEPWSGKIPHVAEQLGPWATITEPACLEPVLRNKRGPRTAMKSGPPQWLRVRLPMQGTRVQALVREDPTCHGATKPVRRYWACALEPACHNYWAHEPQLLQPAHLEPVLRNKRSPHARSNWRKPACINEDPTQPINK